MIVTCEIHTLSGGRAVSSPFAPTTINVPQECNMQLDIDPFDWIPYFTCLAFIAML